jgi:hypothetical protein
MSLENAAVDPVGIFELAGHMPFVLAWPFEILSR